jgi:hypothetical protein
VFGDGSSNEAAPGEANAKGAEFGEVGGAIVEGGEVVAQEGVSEGGREGPVAEIALEFGVFGKNRGEWWVQWGWRGRRKSKKGQGNEWGWCNWRRGRRR